jgi:REP-associated tyrosine transposase
MNPVRAEMVKHPTDYRWSSYRANGLGEKSDLVTPHALYQRLGKNDDERQVAYRELF